jgi:hypothetical protein
MSRIDSWHWKFHPHIKFLWYRTMLNFCGIVVAILKIATGRNFSMSWINRDILIYAHIKFWWYRTMLNFYRPFFMPCFGQTFWKFWKRRIAPLMVTYHYVKFYVSIIIHLEVININVRNFNFPMLLVGSKVFSFVVKGVKVIFWGVQRGWGLL